mgnify:CR=1 FL=1
MALDPRSLTYFGPPDLHAHFIQTSKPRSYVPSPPCPYPGMFYIAKIDKKIKKKTHTHTKKDPSGRCMQSLRLN